MTKFVSSFISDLEKHQKEISGNYLIPKDKIVGALANYERKLRKILKLYFNPDSDLMKELGLADEIEKEEEEKKEGIIDEPDY